MLPQAVKALFQPSSCPTVKLEWLLSKALTQLFGLPDNSPAFHAAKAYLDQDRLQPNARARSAVVLALGFQAVPLGGQVLRGRDKWAKVFQIGDAVLPAWFRFGIGIDDALYGGRAFTLCSTDSPHCDEAVDEHERELRKRAVQMLYDLWATQRQEQPTVEKLLVDLVHEACVKRETARARTGEEDCGDLEAETWSDLPAMDIGDACELWARHGPSSGVTV